MKKKGIIRIFAVSILYTLLSLQNASAQAPAISYSGPQIYITGVSLPVLTPLNTGGTPAVNGQASLLAGNTTAGFADGIGSAASFSHPAGIVADASGNIYVADASNQRIRKITPLGVVTTFAGSGTAGHTNGTGTAAQFNTPNNLAIDGAGNIYVADAYNYMIRKITPGGVVTTLAGSGNSGSANGTGTAATFNVPTGVAVDPSGNVYVVDNGNNLIRKITAAGVVTTFAGSGAAGAANGTGTAASFNSPTGVCLDPSGNLYIADKGNFMIRMITPAGVVTTLAGSGTGGTTDGTGSAAKFNYPRSIVMDAQGMLYVADQQNNKIRKITPAGVVTTLSGTGTAGSNNAAGSSATFYNPFAVTIDASGDLFIADYSNNEIRKVTSTAYTLNQPLPAGMSFNGTTGAISGIATNASALATYTATAYNASGSSSASINITVNAQAAPVPTASQNYVMTSTTRVSGITTSAGLTTASASNNQVETSIQYIDGLGRPLQSIAVKASPTGKDLVQPYAYDNFSRDSVKYLPYTVSTTTPGAFQTGALNGTGGYTGGAQYQFYQQTGQGYINNTYPYSGTNFEPSALDRPIEDGAPGAAWQLSTSGVSGSGHTVKIAYTLNNSTAFSADSVNGLQVAWYNATINSDQSRTLVANSYYPANQLTVTISKDENWVSGRAGTVEEYKDKEGHAVLKRQYNYTTALQVLSTYYVYDDMGELAFVLPPLSGADGAGTISQTTLNNLCYQYHYDDRGRMSGKKIPGKGWEYIVYNYIDQPVATQDANQMAAKQWIFTKYDGVGRPIMTGIWNNGGTAIIRDSLQATLTRTTTNLWETPGTTGYSNAAWPTTNVTATLTLDYYDNYTNVPGLASTPYTAPTGATIQTRGLPTTKMTTILNTPTNMLWGVMYYDDLGRNIKSYGQHYLGGTLSNNNYDAVTTTYDFTNAPTTVTRQHWNTTSTTYPLVTIANTYVYDHMGRKLKAWEQITNSNNNPTPKTLISQVDYNEVGQVLTKHLHSVDSLNFLQNVAYTYNERGWLLSSSAPLFAMQLYYNTGSSGKAYNGNIAFQYWGTPGSLTKSYTYTYDKLNRLTGGIATTGNSEQNIVYDQMGNITALNRYTASALTDQLAYTYTSGGNPTNQLQSIADGSGSSTGLVAGTTTYTYDGNGNMLSAGNSGNNVQDKSFTYNLLNLPMVATVHTGTITYVYDAAGNKLRKVSAAANNNTDYISGIQYDGTTTPTLSFIQTEEGRALPNGATYNYEYNLGDNLGNVRITFDSATGVARQAQQDDYYPFGMEISGNLSAPKNEYLYNKKELQEELQEYDYGARFYDAVIGRWNVVDAYAEHPDQIDLSPYAYVGNNPVDKTDPDGNCPPCDVPADDGVFDRYIRAPTDGEKLMHPTRSAIQTADIAILDFIGIRGLINAVGHLGDKNVPTHEKVANVVGAVLNVMPVDGEGEGSNGLHKNSNDYVGHQGVYEIKVDGELEKYGKSDMTKTSKKTGEPVRLQSQLNKIQKAKPAADVQGKVIYEHKNISTKEIKAIETLNINDFKKKNGKNPPGNKNHPGTN